jgi:predicted ester cyclase
VSAISSRWTITGTHKGEFQGVPPSGRQITMNGIDMSRVVEGKLAEHWAQFDVIGVMQQIGAMPTQA